MTDNVIHVKKGDRLPKVRARLSGRDDTGAKVIKDLTGCTVRMLVRLISAPSSTTATSYACTVDVDPTSGWVEYAWAAGNTDTPGTYFVEFEVTDGSGKQETFPNDGFVTLDISAALG